MGNAPKAIIAFVSMCAVIACSPPISPPFTLDESCVDESMRSNMHIQKLVRNEVQLCDEGRMTPTLEATGYVSRQVFEADGEEWPLTVPAGFVGCADHVRRFVRRLIGSSVFGFSTRNRFTQTLTWGMTS